MNICFNFSFTYKTRSWIFARSWRGHLQHFIVLYIRGLPRFYEQAYKSYSADFYNEQQDRAKGIREGCELACASPGKRNLFRDNSGSWIDERIATGVIGSWATAYILGHSRLFAIIMSPNGAEFTGEAGGGGGKQRKAITRNEISTRLRLKCVANEQMKSFMKYRQRVCNPPSPPLSFSPSSTYTPAVHATYICTREWWQPIRFKATRLLLLVSHPYELSLLLLLLPVPLETG